VTVTEGTVKKRQAVNHWYVPWPVCTKNH